MPQGKFKFANKPSSTKKNGPKSKNLHNVRKGAPKKAKVVKENQKLYKEVEKYIRNNIEQEVRIKAGDGDFKKKKK